MTGKRVSTAIEPVYVPRRFADGGIWDLEGCSFKLHLVSHDTSARPFVSAPDIVDAARLHAASLVAEMERLGEHFGLGYVILHEGDTNEHCWLLFDWWIPGGTHCRIISRALHSEPTRFERVAGPYVACVWEEVCANFERARWIDTVLGGPRDPEAYLAARLAEGLY